VSADKSKEQVPQPHSRLADDEPNPEVKPPALTWLYKSYKPEKVAKDGAKPAEEVEKGT